MVPHLSRFLASGILKECLIIGYLLPFWSKTTSQRQTQGSSKAILPLSYCDLSFIYYNLPKTEFELKHEKSFFPLPVMVMTSGL